MNSISCDSDFTFFIKHTNSIFECLFTYAKRGGEKILTKMAQIDVFCQMMQDAGFIETRAHILQFGIVYLYEGVRAHGSLAE